ncbi:MAG TPA: SRPBCC domain-containing protein [Caulobacteraceae bacterium]|jgi:uncharacterized protein YndB with AHSA1/START domain|nr:SRPBCC domain-containing protein [Caulobacteraceae bacterium]
MPLAAPNAAAAEPEEARSIVFTRVLNAPRELVFQCFTTAEHLAHWWGPTGFSLTTRAFDFRVGGIWRFVMHGPDGRDYENRIVFDVIDPPSRLLAHHDAGEDAVEKAEHETRLTLEAAPGGTRLEWRMVFPSIAERDRVVRDYGAEEGCRQTVGRLADYLAELG